VEFGVITADRHLAAAGRAMAIRPGGGQCRGIVRGTHRAVPRAGGVRRRRRAHSRYTLLSAGAETRACRYRPACLVLDAHPSPVRQDLSLCPPTAGALFFRTARGAVMDAERAAD